MTTHRLIIDRRQGAWLGVCRGVADWTGLPVGLLRVLLVLLTICSFGIPGVIVYALIGYLAGE